MISALFLRNFDCSPDNLAASANRCVPSGLPAVEIGNLPRHSQWKCASIFNTPMWWSAILWGFANLVYIAISYRIVQPDRCVLTGLTALLANSSSRRVVRAQMWRMMNKVKYIVNQYRGSRSFINASRPRTIRSRSGRSKVVYIIISS